MNTLLQASTTDTVNTSRRHFIVGSAAIAGGGFALGLAATWSSSAGAQSLAMVAPGDSEVTAWVVIKPDDTCIIRIARSEMGQGTRTGLAQLVTEELECDWAKVATEYPSPGQSYARKRAWGEMSTGGSRGIRISEDYVRRGAAAARIMLLQAAGEELKVPVSELTVSKGIITHAASKRTISYGKIAAAAGKLTPPDPKSITLRNPREWKVAGQSMRRLDTKAKLNGSLMYAADLRFDGMLCAAIKACPVHGGKLVSFDESKIKSMRGVKGAVRVNEGTVAVLADTWWRAKTALEKLPTVWDEGQYAKASSATIAASLKAGLVETGGQYAGRTEGDALKAIAGASKKIEATYTTPFLSHACMEPMAAPCATSPSARRPGCQRKTARRRTRHYLSPPACRSTNARSTKWISAAALGGVAVSRIMCNRPLPLPSSFRARTSSYCGAAKKIRRMIFIAQFQWRG